MNGFTTNGIVPKSNGKSPRRAKHPHVLIIGGGIIGLILAQALRRHHPQVTFGIYERDADPLSRGAGWGLTLHWALETLLGLLPQDIIDRLEETYVDPPATAAGDGNFLLYDLRTGEERYRVPPNRRIRVKREVLRRLLMSGLEVQWSKKISSISTTDEGVTAHFADSTSASGDILVGADGSRSAVRHVLCPSKSRNTHLPVRLLGAHYACSDVKAAKIHALDPFFLQASDPKTDAFLWFSFLNTPHSNPERPHEYTCQVLTSFPHRPGFLGHAEPLEVPHDTISRIRLMRSFATGWVNPFGSMVRDIPDDADVKLIALEDWPPPSEGWNNMGGRVTLLGDAAHAMTMYRGEAANHGILDVASFLEQLGPYLSSPPSSSSAESPQKATTAYEQEMIKRTRPAVLTSRRACLDAHEHERINDKSPLVSRRAVVTEES